MSGLRHDAKKCREHAKSETIRAALGIETPKEIEKRLEREETQAKAKAKTATKGIPLINLTN
jgi:6,7-dimethyl-8-ribityllumazine synthase